MVKRPSIPILTCYIIGVIASRYLKSNLMLLFVLLFLVFYFLLLFGFHHDLRNYIITGVLHLVLPVFLLLGCFLPSYYQKLSSIPESMVGQKVTVQGKIRHVLQKPSYQEIYLVDVRVRHGEQIATVNQLILQDKSEEMFTVGDELIVEGELEEFAPATNPGQFDTKSYYKAKGIHYHIWDGCILRRRVTKNFFYRGLNAVTCKISDIYRQTLPEEDSEVLHAMILGDKSELSSDIKNLYQKAGISHLLAISGLHISMIGLFLFKVLKKIGLHHNLASILCILLIWSYGELTGFSVSTNRAVVMMVLSLAGCLVNRSYDSCSAIACSAFLILIQEPYQLFQSGFQLSFLAVFGAVVFYPLCIEYLGWCFPDYKKKMLMKAHSEYYSLSVWADKITGLFRKSLLVSSCIQLITLPVIVCNYYEVSMYAPVLNLMVIPLASLLLLLGIGIAIVGVISLPVARFLGGGVHCILWFYQVLCQAFQKLPYTQLVTGRPENWKLIMFAAVIVLFMVMVKLHVHKAAGIFLGVASLLLLVKTPVKGLELTMLDVGQGECIFMENEEGTTFMVDGGSTDVKEVGAFRILPFLRYSGVRVLNYCFLTHMDEDHISGVLELLDYAGENQDFVLENMVLTYSATLEEKGQVVIAKAKKTGTHVLIMKQEDFVHSGDFMLRCIHPSEGFHGEDSNSSSMVLEVGYKEFSALLTGDVDEAGEEAILTSKELRYRQYSLLKVAHHGSRYSSGETFLERVKAKWAIISCGENNHYGHPHEEVLERLKKVNVNWLTTARSGAIRIRVKKKGYAIWGHLD